MNVQDASLTREQVTAVQSPGPMLVVRGVAGSGKSLVLLKRAIRFAEKGEPVVLFTYNVTLRHWMESLVRQLAVQNVVVENFDRWARNRLVEMDRAYTRIASSQQRKRAIEKALENVKGTGSSSRVLQRDVSWWEEELSWIKGCDILSRKEYAAADRKGRGSALGPTPRRAAWAVLESYREMMIEADLHDWDDIGTGILRRLERQEIPAAARPAHVLVDEAQDLSVVKVLALKLLPQATLTISADIGQKIYKTTFSWKRIAIDPRRDGQKLSKSFRSTKQIVRLASAIRAPDEARRAEEERTSEVLPEYEGPLPTIYSCGDAEDQYDLAVRLARAWHGKFPSHTVGVFCRFDAQLQKTARALARAGLPTETVKRDQGDLVGAGVKVMTLHTAKGLEFDHVIIPFVDEGTLPISLPSSMVAGDAERPSEEDLEEFLGPERRLLYVAMTRAKMSLDMMHGPKPSRFLEGLDPDLYVAASS